MPDAPAGDTLAGEPEASGAATGDARVGDTVPDAPAGDTLAGEPEASGAATGDAGAGDAAYGTVWPEALVSAGSALADRGTEKESKGGAVSSAGGGVTHDGVAGVASGEGWGVVMPSTLGRDPVRALWPTCRETTSPRRIE